MPDFSSQCLLLLFSSRFISASASFALRLLLWSHFGYAEAHRGSGKFAHEVEALPSLPFALVRFFRGAKGAKAKEPMRSSVCSVRLGIAFAKGDERDQSERKQNRKQSLFAFLVHLCEVRSLLRIFGFGGAEPTCLRFFCEANEAEPKKNQSKSFFLWFR